MAGKTPKHTIRLVLIWIVPFVSMFLGCSVFGPIVMALCMMPVEIPKLRAKVFSPRMRKQLPCLKAPALMRLAVLWMLQVWWIILWRAELAASMAADEAATAEASVLGTRDGTASATDGGTPIKKWRPRTISVVVPCATNDYVSKTVHAIYDSLPTDFLQEIIVVDDGNDPAIALQEEDMQKGKVRVMRRAKAGGLVSAKRIGGDSAAGDIVAFFDCHVAPKQGWHSSFIKLASDNYRRILVPFITPLDINTWSPAKSVSPDGRGDTGFSKSYLMWDGDAGSFDSDDAYAPLISSGHFAISKRWWDETGGFDPTMGGASGEAVDLSLRSWLCGGEIMMAKDVSVAVASIPSDPLTDPKVAETNRMRAVAAWFGDFTEKLGQYPALEFEKKGADGAPWYGRTDKILEAKKRLNCQSLSWFLHRFKHIYEDGGLLPAETFSIQTETGDHCLTYKGQPGTSKDGQGFASLEECNPNDERQRWHGANRDVSKKGRPCCSGLRAWNTDQCLSGSFNSGGPPKARTTVCDVSGHTAAQAWQLTEGGFLQHPMGFMKHSCLEPDDVGGVKQMSCPTSFGPSWRKENVEEPLETRLYREDFGVGSA